MREGRRRGENVAPAAQATACLHCGLRLSADAEDEFCCAGCRSVYRLLRDEGLDRYYDLRGARGVPVPSLHLETRDRKWLEELEAEIATADESCRLDLDVQGIHCSACVWLIEELFRREDGGVRALVNPALGKVELAVERAFPLRRFVDEVERFGYLLGPAKKELPRRTDDLLLRTAICIALAMNSMLFSAAIYLGLEEGTFYAFVHRLDYALAVVAVLVGGSVFIRSAWNGLRRGILHLDTPIALGIVLAFAGSSWSFFFGEGRAAYLDTITIFIALMLLGRWLQERVLERNRNQLLASDGVDGLLARRVRGDALETVPCREIAAADVLLVAPGDLVPVDGTLLDDATSFSLDWIKGESAPRRVDPGETVPAGAFNASPRAVRVLASTDFAESQLVALLRTPSVARDPEGARATDWWRRFGAIYVTAVLASAAIGVALWLWLTGDAVQAVEVATAVLVITCPCAFGIATPLAYELVQGGLRRAGLFVRAAGFLDRVPAVRRVVFDKTGTLTTGSLRVVDRSPLDGLGADERAALYDLAARSTHPKSKAIARALEHGDVAFRPALDVREVPGAGVEATIAGSLHRLGRASWAAPFATFETEPDVVYAVDHRVRAAVSTEETLRPDAASEIERLAREGHELWILSGDAPEKVRAMATRLGLSETRAIGGCSPERKAKWVDEHDLRDTLFIGDGINDTLVAERAYVSGTPAIDRPFLPARTDFYFVTPGLEPIALALRASRRLSQVVRRNLVFAVAYNAGAVALAWAGLMTPWLAAVLMPASSLAIIAATTAALSGRSALWKS